MKSISLDKQGIYSYQQNREPYLMIDYATEIIPGKSSAGYKDFKSDEWFFKVHWPSDPNVPGMLQIEALVQMCALSILTLPNNKGKIVYLTSANNLKFIKKIVPNTRLYIKTNVKIVLKPFKALKRPIYRPALTGLKDTPKGEDGRQKDMSRLT